MKKIIRMTAVAMVFLSLCLVFSSCSGNKTDANGIVYTLDSETDTYSVTGYTGTSSAVTIPDKFNSLLVTSIAPGAFKGNTNIKSVTIPETVKTVGTTAFLGCTELTEVIFDGTSAVSEIATGTFSGCTKLNNVVIPDSVKSIGYKAFADCTAMTTLTLPKALEVINHYAFSECTTLETVIFDEAQSFKVYANAFYKCNSLTTLMTPEAVTEEDQKALYTYRDGLLTEGGTTLVKWLKEDSVCKIGADITNIKDGAFYYQYEIIKFEVAEGNNNFFADETGVLYSKDKTKLIAYPAGKDLGEDGVFEVPTEYGLKEIASYAFCGTSYVKKIILPETLEKIGDSAFRSCSKLMSLVTGAGKINVGSNAFDSCGSFESYKNLPKDAELVISGRVVFNKEETELISYPAELDAAEYTVPKTVTAVKAGAFAFNSSLTAIKVEEGSTKLVSENGVLYEINEDKEKTTLCAYPIAKTDIEYTMPETVTKVLGYAFYGNASLEKVTLADECAELSEYMFKNCVNLKELIILSNELDIGNNALAGCEALATVKFGGNMTAWNKAVNNASGAENQAILGKITLGEGDYNYTENTKS